MKTTIVLTKDGKIHTDAEGFNGPQCMIEIQKLLAGLVTQEVDTKRKNEYYANETEASTGA
jgi:hypothetical protein